MFALATGNSLRDLKVYGTFRVKERTRRNAEICVVCVLVASAGRRAWRKDRRSQSALSMYTVNRPNAGLKWSPCCLPIVAGVCSASCAHAFGCMYVWEGEVHYCCLKNNGIFYCSNVWWDHVPDANCTGVKGEHCS